MICTSKCISRNQPHPRLENWVFASPQQERLKLIDFGLATQIVTEGRLRTLPFVATVDWMSYSIAVWSAHAFGQNCGGC